MQFILGANDDSAPCEASFLGSIMEHPAWRRMVRKGRSWTVCFPWAWILEIAPFFGPRLKALKWHVVLLRKPTDLHTHTDDKLQFSRSSSSTT